MINQINWADEVSMKWTGRGNAIETDMSLITFYAIFYYLSQKCFNVSKKNPFQWCVYASMALDAVLLQILKKLNVFLFFAPNYRP